MLRGSSWRSPSEEGAVPVSTELAVRWANLPAGTTPIWRAHRSCGLVRGFARYLHSLDPANEIPPRDVLAAGSYRPGAPYLYSDDLYASQR